MTTPTGRPAPSPVRRAVRRVLDLLPPLRADALRAIARAVPTLLTGRPPRQPASRTSKAPPAASQRPAIARMVRPVGEAAADAAARLTAAGVARPLVLGYWPAYDTNPFQRLLYRSAWASGVAPIRLDRLDDAMELASLRETGAEAAVHVHWTNEVLRRSPDEIDAEDQTTGFLLRLDALQGAGIRLVWTIHNVLPHEVRFPDHELRVVRALAERSDVIHVLTEATSDAARPLYELPADRILHVPHPSYAGSYPDLVDRQVARHALGIDAQAKVFLLIGGLRAYKGLDTLLAAWRVASAEDASRVLVVAGWPFPSQDVADFLAAAGQVPTIRLHAGRIATDDMATFLRASDVAVLPYSEGLNSGALMLVCTFGLPAVVPDRAGFRASIEAGAARAFAGGDAVDLARALSEPDLLAPSAREAALAFAAAHDPEAISAAFAETLRTRLGL